VSCGRATQSRIASLIASLQRRLPASTPTTVAPSSRIAHDVQRLPAHVLGAHVDDALEAEQRAGGRRRHAVLAGAGFGDDRASCPSASASSAWPIALLILCGAGVGQSPRA
jgi:hypothetical protein